MNAFKVVEMFEDSVAKYTGSPYAVAVDSCTDALFLCCYYMKVKEVTIPRHTYLSVPQSIMQAGGNVKFETLDWSGLYQLKPYPIYDSAQRFTKDMYIPGSMTCLSFHIKKQYLRIGKGGMILTDDEEAVKWLRKARYQGRDAKPYDQDNIQEMGWNMYMTPPDAARGLWLMDSVPDFLPDGTATYPDLLTNDLFKNL